MSVLCLLLGGDHEMREKDRDVENTKERVGEQRGMGHGGTGLRDRVRSDIKEYTPPKK